MVQTHFKDDIMAAYEEALKKARNTKAKALHQDEVAAQSHQTWGNMCSDVTGQPKAPSGEQPPVANWYSQSEAETEGADGNLMDMYIDTDAVPEAINNIKPMREYAKDSTGARATVTREEVLG